jgi:hypothetical protein
MQEPGMKKPEDCSPGPGISNLHNKHWYNLLLYKADTNI